MNDSEIQGGLDEVGYGSLAGPFIAVVAVFRQKDFTFLPPGVTDSKKLSHSSLEALYDPICAAASDIGIGHAMPEEIDRLGVSVALQLTYQRAIEELVVFPSTLIVDGNKPVKSWKGKQIVEPKADLNHKVVSAASIIAKVWRDRLMTQLSKQFPEYRWDSNKGYGSEEHFEAIKKNGLVLPGPRGNEYIHRKVYCKRFLND